MASLVEGVQRELAEVWPTLRLLDHIGGKTDEVVINFSIEKARDHAWRVAEELAPLALLTKLFAAAKEDRYQKSST